MSVVVKIISAVIKSVVGDKIGNELVNEVIGISIDGGSEKGIDKIIDYINGEKAKIEHILSRENMKSLNILEENIDYVVAEIKDLLSEVEITDEVLRQCKYDSMNLSALLWNEYCERKNDPIECEYDIEKGLCAVSEALIKLARESEYFENNILVQISNTVDDTNVELQKISEYIKENFSKLDDNSQIVLNLLLTILKQIQKKNMQGNDAHYSIDEKKEFKNNKKQDYIKNWNSRMFLHVDNDERPITLADAFIMPDYKIHKSTRRIGFSENDTLDKIIEKFVNYEKTSTMLITGVPGIGKSSITSWIANEYKNNDNVVVLRFRDWKKVILEKTLLEAIYNKLNCEEDDLENRILVLDGFDEMKALNIRDRLLNEFFTDIKNFENFKCIITSRPDYIDSNRFSYVVMLKEFDLCRIEDFYRIITGSKLEERGRIESNLEVLGIPVILYMAIMSKIDISENPTKPELYNCIFAEEGGIFDKFNNGITEYSSGAQILRIPENIYEYLNFLRKIAFKMFEKNDLVLSPKEYQIPQLQYQGNSVSVLEFPIKHLFENTEFNIEFIHKSLYEYFASEYIFNSLNEATKSEVTKDNFAGILGDLLVKNRLSPEILEFLQYKIAIKLGNTFSIVNEVFRLMLRDGMTYYTQKLHKNVIECEMTIFSNMLEILHLWGNVSWQYDFTINKYLQCNYLTRLNLKGISLVDRSKEVDLSGVKLVGANLEEANLVRAGLERVNLEKANLRKANLMYSNLEGANLREANLRKANLMYSNLNQANLSGADLSGAIFVDAHLAEANFINAKLDRTNFIKANIEKAVFNIKDLSEAIFSKKQIEYIKEKYNLQDINVYIGEFFEYDEFYYSK